MRSLLNWPRRAALAVLCAASGSAHAAATITTTTTRTTIAHHAHAVIRHSTAVTRDSHGRVIARIAVKQTLLAPPHHPRAALHPPPATPHPRLAAIPPHPRHPVHPLAARIPPHPVPRVTPPPPPPAPVAKAPPAVDPTRGTATGLKLPRFAALRSDQVSVRAGPGTRYPIQWVYQRRDLPVKIEREFEVWRLISLPDGFRGWVHLAMLTGRRGFFVGGDQPQTLRAAAGDTAEPVAILKPGVVGRLTGCAAATPWCAVEVKTYKGFLSRDAIWGLLPDEVVGP